MGKKTRNPTASSISKKSNLYHDKVVTMAAHINRIYICEWCWILGEKVNFLFSVFEACFYHPIQLFTDKITFMVFDDRIFLLSQKQIIFRWEIISQSIRLPMFISSLLLFQTQDFYKIKYIKGDAKLYILSSFSLECLFP